MQNADATVDVQEPVKQVDAVVMTAPKSMPKDEPENRMVNKNDRVMPEPDEEQKTGKSKFAIAMKPLTTQEMNRYLGVDGLDGDKIKVEEALIKGKDLHLKLDNGQSIIFGRDADGYASIKFPDAKNPDAATMLSAASLAKSMGWKDITVHSNNEEFRALSYFAITNAGLIMNSPPPTEVLEKYRERFEQTLKTGVDPVAQERREKAAEAAAKKEAGLDAKEPKEPAAKTPDAPAQEIKRPAVRSPAAPRM